MLVRRSSPFRHGEDHAWPSARESVFKMQSGGDDVKIWKDWRVLASSKLITISLKGEPVMDREGEILTLDEISAYLKIGKRTAYRLAQKGEIPAFKLGGTWRFRRSELDRWIAESISKKKPEAE